MELPKNEKSFDVSLIGETTGKKYEGTFTVKCVLNISDKRRLEIERSRLSADTVNPSVSLSAISGVVANLRIRVVQGPEWFKQSIDNLDFLDEDILYEVFSKCMEKSEEWTSEVKKKSVGEPLAGN
jgi:hypothetical protein